jgi:hypothetical protein
MPSADQIYAKPLAAVRDVTFCNAPDETVVDTVSEAVNFKLAKIFL